MFLSNHFVANSVYTVKLIYSLVRAQLHFKVSSAKKVFIFR